MFAALRAFFAVFTTLFMAGEKAANSVLIIAGIGETMALSYQDTTIADREINEIKARTRRTKALAKAKAEALAIEAQP